MNKLYCDFCGDEIPLGWSENNQSYMLEIKRYQLTYDICSKCSDKLQHMSLNKTFKEPK